MPGNLRYPSVRVTVAAALVVCALGGALLWVGDYAASKNEDVCPPGTYYIEYAVPGQGFSIIACRDSRTHRDVPNVLPHQREATGVLSPRNAHYFVAAAAILWGLLFCGYLIAVGLLNQRGAPSASRLERGRVVHEDASLTTGALQERAMQEPDAHSLVSSAALYTVGLRRDPVFKTRPRAFPAIVGLVIVGLLIAATIDALVIWWNP